MNENEILAEQTEELIAAVKAGSQGAFSELLQLYTPLIRSMVAKYAPENASQQDFEDLGQDALAVFYNAIMSYDLEQNGVKFGLYAKICIGNRLISSVRIMNKRSRGLIGLDDADAQGEENGIASDPAWRIVQEENFKALYSRICANLSEYENRIWWLYTSGAHAKDIAERIGKDEKSVSNAIYRIRKKLRELLK
jgi:RNA polymerase sporulation-specific sigma factor